MNITTLPGERLKYHPRYENFLISSHGRVFKEIFRWHTYKQISPYKHRKGYWIVNITIAYKKRRHCYIHRLVAETYIPNPCGFPEVDHIDENKSNNGVDNLQWMDHRDNCLKSFRKKFGDLWVPKDKSNKTGRTRMSIEDARKIRASGKRIGELAKEYGKHYQTIWRIKKGIILGEKS
jgi:hypothetical protein